MGNQQPLNGQSGAPPGTEDILGGQQRPNATPGGGSNAPYAPGGYVQTPPPQHPGGAGGGAGSGYGYADAYDPQVQLQQQQQQHIQQQGESATPMDAEQPMVEGGWLDDDTVPTVFRWEHGGRQVYITGTFNGWSRQIPMHRSGNDFTYIHNLKRGKHAFKFIVDDEWRFAPDQPTVADIEGRINNFIDVTEFKAYTGDRDFEKEKAAAEYGCYGALPDGQSEGGEGGPTVEEVESKDMANKPDKDGELFTQNMPDLDEYTKEPPPLPPHLRHIILNKPPQLQDTAALPVPQHVALNHLYCTAIRDNMMVLGITQRYKTKFVTTVYYSPCSSA
jgi:5'-AMP-activated protein kinase regulatory beta subunit